MRSKESNIFNSVSHQIPKRNKGEWKEQTLLKSTWKRNPTKL
jgi:hypothetical protein